MKTALAAVMLAAVVRGGCGGSDPGVVGEQNYAGTWRGTLTLSADGSTAPLTLAVTQDAIAEGEQVPISGTLSTPAISGTFTGSADMSAIAFKATLGAPCDGTTIYGLAPIKDGALDLTLHSASTTCPAIEGAAVLTR